MRRSIPLCAVSLAVAGFVAFSTALAASSDRLVAPTLVAPSKLQRQLYLHLDDRIQLPSRMSGDDMVWQKLIGKQTKEQPPRYVRIWIRPDGRGGAQILGRRSVEFEDIGVELHWPKISWASRDYRGMKVSVPQRSEGPREKWQLVGGARKRGKYTLGCDLGPTEKFSARRATWTAEFHRWRYDPLAGLGDWSRPARHDFVVLYCVLDLTTSDKLAAEGEPVEVFATCRLRQKQPAGVFLLYRVAAFWQDARKSYVHVPAYPGTAYWAPVEDKSLRPPHLFAWLFPKQRYQIILVYVVGLEDGFGGLKTSALLRSQIIEYKAEDNVIDFLNAEGFGHSIKHAETSGPVWDCGLSPNIVRVEPDGRIVPLDSFAPQLKLWVGQPPAGQPVPETLDEAVSWDEELMWSGGARIAYVGIITGEIPPDQQEWYRRWVERVHELGYKAAIGWNCTEIFPTDYTYKKHHNLVAQTADKKDVLSPHLGFKGVVLNWLSRDWQIWAGETARKLADIGFDYIFLDWSPIDNVHYHYLLAPMDYSFVDWRTKTSLSVGNPAFFSYLANKYRGRIFLMGDSGARRFSDYLGAPVGQGYFAWNRAMTETAGWVNAPRPTKAAAFERWCQMAAMRMAYPGVPSMWRNPRITGVYCYLAEPGMRVLKIYSDVVRRMEKECWGLCMDLPCRTSNGVNAYARLFLPNAWARGRFYLLVAADRDTTVTVPLPMLEGRYMVCDVVNMRIWSAEGDLQVPVSHDANMFYPTGGLRALVLQRLR